MVTTLVALLVMALLVVVVARATLGPSATRTATTVPVTPLSDARATEARQNLQSALGTLEQTDVDGQGSISVTALRSDNPSLTFTTGPSTGADSISVAVPGDNSSITLAARAGDGCWWLWWSGVAVSYGHSPSAVVCQATTLNTAPTDGPSTLGVTWKSDSFPAS